MIANVDAEEKTWRRNDDALKLTPTASTSAARERERERWHPRGDSCVLGPTNRRKEAFFYTFVVFTDQWNLPLPLFDPPIVCLTCG